MSQIEILHEEAMDIAEEAFRQRRKGNSEKAIRLFSQALELESQAASTFLPEKASEPTRSVLYRSAASLAFHAKKYQFAQRLIAQGLSGYPPSEIETELKDLYEQVNFEHHLQLRGIALANDDFQLSIQAG